MNHNYVWGFFHQKNEEKMFIKILRAWNLVSNIANYNLIFKHHKDDQVISRAFKKKKIVKIKIVFDWYKTLMCRATLS